MENFRPPLAASPLPDSVERLPFDIVRTLVAARQAATPTAHLIAGRANTPAPTASESPDGLLRLMLGDRAAADTAPTIGARFASCTVGRIAASAQEVSA